MTAGERSGPSEDAGRTRDSGRAKDATARRTAVVVTRLRLRLRKRFHLNWNGQLIELDYLRVPVREWSDHPQSRDDDWFVLEDTGDFIVACRVLG